MIVMLKFDEIANYKDKIFEAIPLDETVHDFLSRIKSNFISFLEVDCDYKIEIKFLGKKDEEEFDYKFDLNRSILQEFDKLFAFNCFFSVFVNGSYTKEGQTGIFIDTPEHGEVKIVKPIFLKVDLYKRHIVTDSGDIISRDEFFSTIKSFGFKFKDIDSNTEQSIDKLDNYLDSIRKFE